MNISITRIGYWSALVAFFGAAGYSTVQILQIVGVLMYPLDEILIFGISLLIPTPFMIALLAVQHLTPNEKRFWINAALLFAVMYNTFVTINYVVQLTAVIPYANPDPVLRQTPHSLLWTLDALGYIFLGFATLFAIPVFAKHGLQKWLRRFFLANGLIIPLFCIVYFYPTFSVTLLLLALPWVIIAPGSILLLALFLRKRSVLGSDSD
jgi:hypothetical protein